MRHSIKQAAKKINERRICKYCKYVGDCKTPSVSSICYRNFENGFISGAKWAKDNLWISVNDKLPKYDEQVMVICNNDIETAYFNHRSDNPHVITTTDGWCDLGDSNSNITHWMRVPKLKLRK